MPDANRLLTPGEVLLLQSVYANRIAYGQVRIHSERWMPVFPNDRAMAPNGHVYFPGDEYAPDFSLPTTPLRKRATFIHEGAHLYQWYGLGQTVWLRGPFDRNYRYTLIPGKAYETYGLEQMGSIAQDYYTLREGGRIAEPYGLTDYAPLLPVKPK